MLLIDDLLVCICVDLLNNFVSIYLYFGVWVHVQLCILLESCLYLKKVFFFFFFGLFGELWILTKSIIIKMQRFPAVAVVPGIHHPMPCTE